MAVHKKYDRNVLGRGLDAIGGGGRGLDALIDTSGVNTQGSSNLSEILLTQIDPNPSQPRREFDQESINELATSIKEVGIIQPITLRQQEGDRYQIVAGERRWRAAQMAGLKSIPAYIRTVDDENVVEMALVENIQREDLNPIEIALAYEHLAETSGMTQELIAGKVGKSRASVANYMRLLKLPAQVQMALKNKTLDMGHARALLSVDSPSIQIKLFKEIEKNGYSVHKVERMIKEIKDGGKIRKRRQTGSLESGEKYDSFRQKLSDIFGTKVEIKCSARGSGSIMIPFENYERLEGLVNALGNRGE